MRNRFRLGLIHPFTSTASCSLSKKHHSAANHGLIAF
jgi:hypothetical protein